MNNSGYPWSSEFQGATNNGNEIFNLTGMRGCLSAEYIWKAWAHSVFRSSRVQPILMFPRLGILDRENFCFYKSRTTMWSRLLKNISGVLSYKFFEVAKYNIFILEETTTLQCNMYRLEEVLSVDIQLSCGLWPLLYFVRLWLIKMINIYIFLLRKIWILSWNFQKTCLIWYCLLCKNFKIIGRFVPDL